MLGVVVVVALLVVLVAAVAGRDALQHWCRRCGRRRRWPSRLVDRAGGGRRRRWVVALSLVMADCR